jgi:hypothetical protein
MRSPRGSFLPAVRVFDAERKVTEDVSRLVGYSMADLVRASLGLSVEHPPEGKVAGKWSLSSAGALRYEGRAWYGDVSALLNSRCVVPQEREGG